MFRVSLYCLDESNIDQIIGRVLTAESDIVRLKNCNVSVLILVKVKSMLILDVPEFTTHTNTVDIHSIIVV